MLADRRADQHGEPNPPERVPDDVLIAAMLGGDEAALRQLIARYDRLVRYTILRASADRCRQDPHWLESIASATWEGFVRSLRRLSDNPPRSASAYIVRIARNQCVTAQRRASKPTESLTPFDEDGAVDIPVVLEEPVETLARLELLEALRGCLAELSGGDKLMTAQLPAITNRRWKEAASILGLSESTLRSRWGKVLDRLRRCIERKTGKDVAPLGMEGD